MWPFVAVLWTKVSGVVARQWGSLDVGNVFWLLRLVAAASPLRCGRITVLLRAFFVIWIHNAIAARCGCGPDRKRNIAAASVDAVRNLNH